MLTIKREYRKLSTISDCFYGTAWICHILERPWLQNENNISCVPEGKYFLIQYDSLKFGVTYALLNPDLDVGLYKGDQKRYACLIHPVTSVYQLKGCLGPGLTTFEPDSVGYSTDATNKLLSLIRSENIISIEIKNAVSS